jgi:hypothetical protein
MRAIEFKSQLDFQTSSEQFDIVFYGSFVEYKREKKIMDHKLDK